MAYVRAHDTTRRKNGKAVKRYEVVWREPVRDEFGVPRPGKLRSRQESYPTRADAEARADELNAARHTSGAATLAEKRKAGDLPFGYYAQAWLDTLAVRVGQGRLKQRTYDDARKRLRHYVLDRFGAQAIASITVRDCEAFMAALAAQRSRQGARDTLSPATVRHAWAVFRAVMRYAVQHGAISTNPCDALAGGRGVGDRSHFEHTPLTATQVADLCAAIETGPPAYPAYGLMVSFLAYTGLRASECAGLEIRDLVFAPGSTGPRCTVQIRRTKDRRAGEWIISTPKSTRSRRSVPLPPWLTERMRAYLDEHPRADEPTAPLFPGRTNAGGDRTTRGARPASARRATALDYSEPVDMGTFYRRIFRPALVAAGLPATAPARRGAAATRGVRVHDLRHSFAVMHLMAGTHFMQVSRWLGHSTFTLTLNTYGDWIPEEDGSVVNHLPEPPANRKARRALSVRELFA